MKKLDLDNALDTIQKAQEMFNLLQKIQPDFQLLITDIPRLLPDLSRIFEDIHEIFPKINEMHHKVETSLNSMPVARTKIENVSLETENTTMNIMDRIDQILDHSMEIDAKLLEIDVDTEKHLNVVNTIKETNQKNQDLLNDIYADLQFQDITSQQLSAARGIIIEISNSLSEIIDRFQVQIDERFGTYDIDASLNREAKNQAVIDEIINEASQS